MEFGNNSSVPSSKAWPQTAIPGPDIEPVRGSILDRWSAPSRKFDPDQPELISRPDVDAESLFYELQILEKANRRLGGRALVLDYAGRLVQQKQLTSIRILDLGTGLADIPRALVSWCRSRHLPVHVTAVDSNLRVIDFARKACRDWPDISLEHQDMLSLPYPANSFDLVICSLAFHHFHKSDAVKILRSISNIAGVGYLVNDLRRNWFSVSITELLARMLIKHAIVKHDAISSCRAAFTVAELKSIADEAGLFDFHVYRHHLGFRMVLQGRK